MDNIALEAPASSLGAAADFLRDISSGGRIAVSAIAPDAAPTSTVFDTTTQAAELAGWLQARNGSANLYYSLNEPSPVATGRLKEADVAAIRGLAVDLDPVAAAEAQPGGYERERNRLLSLADEWSRHFLAAPSVIVDSGNGVQMLWLFPDPLPNTEGNSTAVKAQAKGLGRHLGSDSVQSLDHLFRIPFTTNLPDARKRAKGRVPTTSRLVRCAPRDRAGLRSLSVIAAPVREEPRTAVSLEGFGYAAVLEAALDASPLPSHLVEVVEAMRRDNGALETALAKADRSARDFAVAALTIEAGVTDPTEVAQVTFSLSPDRLLADDEKGRGEYYAGLTVSNALASAKPRPTAADWFGDTAEPAAVPTELCVVEGIVDVAELPVRRWLIQPRLPIGDVTQIVGEPGVSKSTFAIRDALAVATGREDLLSGLGDDGNPISFERLHQAGAVIVYNAEDRLSEMRRRLAAAQRHYGLAAADMKHPIILWSGVDHEELKIMFRSSDREPLRRAPGADSLEQHVRRHAASLVILDPQVGLTRGGRENDNDDQDATMQELAKMASRLGINVTVVHHTSKATREAHGDMGAGRGGFAAVGKVRSAVTLVHVTGKGPGEDKWGVAPADRLIRIDYAKVSHDQKPAEPIVLRRISAPVGNGRGTPTDAAEMFGGDPREQLRIAGDFAPVLEVVDIKARIAAAAGPAKEKADSIAVQVAGIVDAHIAGTNEARLSSVWQEIGVDLRAAGLCKASGRSTIRPYITDPLETGVAVDRDGQRVVIRAEQRGRGPTAQWWVVRTSEAA